MRAKGTASKRKDGLWSTSVRLPNGERRHFYGPSQAAVLRQARALRQAIEDGESGREDRRTVEEYLTEWLETSRQRVRPQTFRRYEQQIRLHAIPVIGGLRLARLGAEDLQRLYAELLARGLSATTVLHLHMNLHHALGQARRWRIVRENVAELVDPPRTTRYRSQTLSADQARELLAAVRGDPLEAIYVVALHTGMRQGEILGLRWADVDLERAQLTVRGSLTRDADRKLVIAETKTKASTHAVLLTKSAVAALRRRKEAQTAERLLGGHTQQQSDLVFTTAAGGPIAGQWLLRRRYYPLLDRLGLPKVRFHDLRHTVATLLLGEGVPVKAVSDLLGHSSSVLTLDTYSHATQQIQMLARDALDTLFPADSEPPKP